MQVKSIAECFKGSILQYFRPSLSYHLPFRPLFCLFLSGRLRQVLLYIYSDYPLPSFNVEPLHEIEINGILPLGVYDTDSLVQEVSELTMKLATWLDALAKRMS